MRLDLFLRSSALGTRSTSQRRLRHLCSSANSPSACNSSCGREAWRCFKTVCPALWSQEADCCECCARRFRLRYKAEHVS